MIPRSGEDLVRRYMATKWRRLSLHVEWIQLGFETSEEIAIIAPFLGWSSFPGCAIMAVSDTEFVKALTNGKVDAWEQFVRQHGDQIYSSCALLFSKPDLDREFLAVLDRLRADNFALLRPFDGRAKLSTYLTLKLTDLLAGRILEFFKEDSSRAWEAFERFFKKDIERAVARYFPVGVNGDSLEDGTSHEDLYQEICCLLLEQDHRRLMSFDGRGGFGAYVRKIVGNLCMDIFRKREGRRRLPETISRLSAVEQQAYRLMHWENHRREELFELLTNDQGERCSRELVERALARVDEAVKARKYQDQEIRFQSLSATNRMDDGERGREMDVADFDNSPDSIMMRAQEDRAEAQAVDLVRRAMTEMEPELRLYLQLRFYDDPPKAPRQIAKLMGRTETEIYKIRQAAMSSLAIKLKASGIKNLELSV
jgi:RNA polymerase primary sigma factor